MLSRRLFERNNTGTIPIRSALTNSINGFSSYEISTKASYQKTGSKPCNFVKFRVDEHFASYFLRTQQSLLFLDHLQKLNEKPEPRTRFNEAPQPP